MIDNARSRQSLEKLLRLAKTDADLLHADLADAERAKEAAEKSLDDLAHAIKKEEANAQTDPAAFAAYMEAMSTRRHNLRTTMMLLNETVDATHERIAAAFGEVKKLEHLIAMQDKAQERTQRRRDVGALDEINARRVSRG